MSKPSSSTILLASLISQKIYFIREARVMLDADLAKLYGVTTAALNRAVQRNRRRFPEDFMFLLSHAETESLRCQSGISKKKGRGGRRYRPYAFSEQGVAMLSSVLRSDRAVQANIAIMRAFLQLRAMLATHEDLRRKINELEKRYDAQFHAVFATLRRMLEAPVTPKRQIEFHSRVEPGRRPKSAFGEATSN